MKSFRASSFLKVALGIVVLLIVLTVISWPVCSIEGARRAQAKNDVLEIAAALRTFQAEYGRLPATDGIVGGETLVALTGEDKNLNPKNIEFLFVRLAKKGKSGVLNGNYVDPWGGSYFFAFNMAGTVTAGTNHAEITNRAAVWNDPNRGTDAEGLSEAKTKRRYVTSWE